jgi:hypothetical protein
MIARSSRSTGNALTVWGSPWPGAARIAGAGAAPLETVVFIRHGAAVGIRHVAPRDAFRRILNTMSMPLWEPARCGRALEILDAIVSRATLIEGVVPPDRTGCALVGGPARRRRIVRRMMSGPGDLPITAVAAGRIRDRQACRG